MESYGLSKEQVIALLEDCIPFNARVMANVMERCENLAEKHNVSDVFVLQMFVQYAVAAQALVMSKELTLKEALNALNTLRNTTLSPVSMQAILDYLVRQA